jgi:predicted SprT family Zn-dependent metalloprotease
METVVTRHAAKVWRQAFGIPWPRGWRVVYRDNPRTRAWGYAYLETKLVVLYRHKDELQLHRTLLHELVHVYLDSHLHSAYFRSILGYITSRGNACEFFRVSV